MEPVSSYMIGLCIKCLPIFLEVYILEPGFKGFTGGENESVPIVIGQHTLSKFR